MTPAHLWNKMTKLQHLSQCGCKHKDEVVEINKERLSVLEK